MGLLSLVPRRLCQANFDFMVRLSNHLNGKLKKIKARLHKRLADNRRVQNEVWNYNILMILASSVDHTHFILSY